MGQVVLQPSPQTLWPALQRPPPLLAAAETECEADSYRDSYRICIGDRELA